MGGGVATLKIETQVLVPQLSIKIRPEAVARFGLTPGIVMQASIRWSTERASHPIDSGATIYYKQMS